jgi:Flp pilus assembly pilin Flp
MLLRLAVRIQILGRDLLADVRGQDMIEYALLAGFVTLSAGAVMTDVADNVFQIFRKVRLVLRCSLGRTRACEAVEEF